MISLIIPFWQRQAAIDEALRVMCAHYMDLDLEIIVVDDGSPEPYVRPRSWPLLIKVVNLPKKNVPLDPCTVFNAGVYESSGDYIALSGPEIRHRAPILEAMKDEIDLNGDKAYVIAACWSTDQNRWHAHSSRIRRNDNDVGAYVPRESDYHFMTMMKRSLWDAAGGMDPEYRQGAGYDDADFVRRLDRAGAQFIRRDDLIVDRTRVGPKSAWTRAQFARNRELFLSKWKPIAEIESVHRKAVELESQPRL